MENELKRLPTNKGLLKYVFFGILTLGIYDLFIISRIAKELNVSCAEDGKHTATILPYILLSIVTLGIYGIVWHCKVCGRMCRTGEGTISGAGYLLWSWLGSMLFGIGPFVATYKLLHSVNNVNEKYNRENGLN